MLRSSRKEKYSVQVRQPTPLNPESIIQHGVGIPFTPEGIARLEKQILDKTGKQIRFEQNKNCSLGDFLNIEQENIFIAPVALLEEDKNHHSWGVYVKKAFSKKLKYPYCLGEYKGVCDKTKKNDSNDSNEDKNYLYTVELDNHVEISAEYYGSWQRMINSAPSEESANTYFHSKNDKVYVYLKRSIEAGKQLLIYYGDNYTFSNYRALHEDDSWLTSFERYELHKEYYKEVVINGEIGMLPNIEVLTFQSIDLPLFMKENGSSNFLPESQQEHETLLHFACRQGDMELLQRVLELSPNTNRRTSLNGYTPLHCVILSNISSQDKIAFIDKLLSDTKTDLVAQDSQHQSVLHLAIAQYDVVLIQYLLEKSKIYSRHRSIDLRSCVNSKNWDFILAAFATGSTDVLRAIKPFIKPNDLFMILNDFEEALLAIWGDLNKKYTPKTCNYIRKVFCELFVANELLVLCLQALFCSVENATMSLLNGTTSLVQTNHSSIISPDVEQLGTTGRVVNASACSVLTSLNMAPLNDSLNQDLSMHRKQITKPFYYLPSNLCDDELIVKLQIMASEKVLIIDKNLSIHQINLVMSNLPYDHIIALQSDLPLVKLQQIAKMAKPKIRVTLWFDGIVNFTPEALLGFFKASQGKGMIFEIQSYMPLNILSIISESLTRDIHLSFSCSISHSCLLTDEKIRTSMKLINSEEVVVRVSDSMSKWQYRLIISLLTKSKTLFLEPFVTANKMEEILYNLPNQQPYNLYDQMLLVFLGENRSASQIVAAILTVMMKRVLEKDRNKESNFFNVMQSRWTNEAVLLVRDHTFVANDYAMAHYNRFLDEIPKPKPSRALDQQGIFSARQKRTNNTDSSLPQVDKHTEKRSKM